MTTSIYDTIATQLITDKTITLNIGNKKPDSVRRGIARSIERLNATMKEFGTQYDNKITYEALENGNIKFKLSAQTPVDSSLGIQIIKEIPDASSLDELQNLLE